MWSTKIGNEVKSLVLGLFSDGIMVDFDSLSGPGDEEVPLLHMRRRSGDQTVLSIPLLPYTDMENSPAKYNVQVKFSEANFAVITAGVWIAEIDADLSGEQITFPDEKYIELRFYGSVD